MFGAPTSSAYDLRFSVAGIPVRVHPLFWLMAFLLGFQSGNPAAILIWVAAMFVSILIHELGHAFTMRYFGYDPSVLLYAGGGLAFYHGESDSIWQNYGARYNRGRDNPWAKILISFAGPAAEFVLAGIVIAYIFVGGIGDDLWESLRNGTIGENYLFTLIVALLVINIFWGAINLFPVYPLDGGQIARELFLMFTADGVRMSLWLSLFTAAALALAGFYVFGMFMGIMFAYFAFMNWQMLNSYGGGGFGGGFGGGNGGDRW